MYLRNPEVEKLIRDLLDCELPYCCPHGRPTMIQISLGELEKEIWSQSLTTFPAGPSLRSRQSLEAGDQEKQCPEPTEHS